jgi:phosphotransferase system  glucose/maltose/N-acetylglucosamine-specific IIC component
MTASLQQTERRSSESIGAQPLSPGTKWRAITLATLVVIPAFWSIVAGLVTLTMDDGEGVANPAAAIAFGLVVTPFAFVVLAVLSEHPRPAVAVLQALGVAVLVGIPVSAVAADGITGLVAAVGVGGAYALREEPYVGRRPRVVALVVVCLYTFLLAQLSAPLALLPAPVFSLTALGLADHLAARHQARSAGGI